MMRQAGRYLPEYREIRAKHAFLEVCKTPQLAVEVSIQPFRRLGVDAVIVFSDILIPAEAMGLQLELGDAGPNLPNPVRSKLDVERLKIFDPEAETGFLPEAIRRIVKSIGPEVPVLGFAGAPWTLACYMVEGKTKEGFATVKSFLYHEPKTFHELLHRIAQATILYLKAQIAAGATAVQLFDTWCGELNLQDYEDFALPAVQENICFPPWRAPARMCSASIGAWIWQMYARPWARRSHCKETSIRRSCSVRPKKSAKRL